MLLSSLFDLEIERSGSSYLVHFRLSSNYQASFDSGVTSYQLVFDFDASLMSDVSVINGALQNIGNVTSGRVEFAGYGIQAFDPGASNTPLMSLSFTAQSEVVALTNMSVELFDSQYNETYQQFSDPIDLTLWSAPVITSVDSVAVDEGLDAGAVAYQAVATDDLVGVQFALKTGLDDDISEFQIDSQTGRITFVNAVDFETKNSYSFTLIATDSDGLVDERAVTLGVNNLDEVAPTITSSDVASIDENAGAEQVVYTAIASDDADISGGVTFVLSDADDHASFSINSETGAVTLVDDPDFESKSSYNFTVVATDAAGNSSTQAITLGVNNLDEVAPTITSSDAASVDENAGAEQVVYTAIASDDADISSGVTFALSDSDDHASFSINSETGAVTLVDDPDFESKSSYNFTVVATDAAGNASTQAVTLGVNNQDEVAPEFADSAVSISIDEESGGDQVVYTTEASDTQDISTGLTYSIAAFDSDDSSLFSMDAETGELTLLVDPDYETASSYALTIVATDGAGHTAQQAVTIQVNDLPEVPEVYVWHTRQLFDSVTKSETGEVNLPITELELGRVISAADALATLKIAVGLNPNRPDAETGEPLPVSPFQYLAADVNQDGRVSAADALSVLKMAVNLEGAFERQWLMVSEDAPLWDEVNDRSLVSRSSIDWDAINAATDSAAAGTKMVGVLRGDTNASWRGSDALDTVPESYFEGDSFQGTGPADQWWLL